MKTKTTLLISCEHAVNTIPEIYQPLFENHQAELHSHLGFDFGALQLAKNLAAACATDVIQATVSRLLIDCNRRLKNPNCFSFITKNLLPADKAAIVAEHYLPYRSRIIQLVDNEITLGHKILHLSIHSFTPIWKNIHRNTDLGLLYAPKHSEENKAAQYLKKIFKEQQSPFKLRMNYPYKGISDGFTQELRQKYKESDYCGIEIEINQALVHNKQDYKKLEKLFILSTQKLLQDTILWCNNTSLTEKSFPF